MSSAEISINAFAPVINQAKSSYNERLQTENETYSISNNVGFDSANFVLTGPLDYLMDWFANGLVRDIVWRDPEGGVCWNGYVNRLGLTAGGETRTRSVDDMANRIIYPYTPLTTANNPPKAGAQTTITKNDTASQAAYGIKAAIVSGGEATAATADDAAYSELAKLKDIREGRQGAFGQGKIPSLQVEMRGYAYMLDWAPYTQTANTGTDNASTIIAAVLAADPNSVLSTSTVNISTCTTAVQKYWDGKQFGWKIVNDIAAMGYESGSVGYEWVAGVFEDRRTTYKQAEAVDSNGVALSTNKYLALHRKLFDAGDSILDDAGREVMPWALRPDRLMYTEGFPGRATYITRVTFSSPFACSYEGTDARNPVASFMTGNCKGCK
jgi:hypothetical protein